LKHDSKRVEEFYDRETNQRKTNTFMECLKWNETGGDFETRPKGFEMLGGSRMLYNGLPDHLDLKSKENKERVARQTSRRNFERKDTRQYKFQAIKPPSNNTTKQ